MGRRRRHSQQLRAHRHVAPVPGAVPEGADRGIRITAVRRGRQERHPRPPQPHQDHREAEGQARGTPERPAGRGQEGRRAGVRRVGRRSRLHRRGPLLQEPGNSHQDGSRRRRPDRRLRVRLRPLHEGPLPGPTAPRPRGAVRHRHADLQHDDGDVHHTALPRPQGADGPRHRPFRPRQTPYCPKGGELIRAPQIGLLHFLQDGFVPFGSELRSRRLSGPRPAGAEGEKRPRTIPRLFRRPWPHAHA